MAVEKSENQLTMSEFLSTWHDELLLENVKNWKQRILLWIRPTLVRSGILQSGLAVSMLSVVLSFVQIIWSSLSIIYSDVSKEGLVGPLIVLGLYSAACSQLFFLWRRKKAAYRMSNLSKVAIEIENAATPEVKETMNSTARFCWRILVADRVYHVLVLMMMTSRAVTGNYVHPIYREDIVAMVPLLRQIVLCGQVEICFKNLYATCHLLVLAMTTTWCSAELYRALGLKIREADDASQLRRLVQLHQALTHNSLYLDKIYSDIMFHYLVTYFFVPLICSFEIVAGRYEFIVLGTLPLAFIFLVPLCSAGQSLMDASASVGFAAYEGKWRLAKNSQRPLYQLMIVRSRVPATISLYGIAHLNYQTCFGALKTWFSYLQMILNFQ